MLKHRESKGAPHVRGMKPHAHIRKTKKPPNSRSIAKPKCQNKSRKSGDEKPKKWTNPHKILAECRWKKHSMSCFFGRRAGTPSAIIRKRPIVNAAAGIAEGQQCRGQQRPATIKTHSNASSREVA